MLTALYRHFDADDRLLYVGISLAPTYRLGAHAHRSHWAGSIARVSIEWFATRPAALEAEAAAIVAEHPLHNVAGKPDQQPRRTKPPPPAPPRVETWVDRPEYVAAHFGISLRAVHRMAEQGMPRERKGRGWRYELRAIEDWARSNAERTNAERQTLAAEKKAADFERMRAAMDNAWGPH